MLISCLAFLTGRPCRDKMYDRAFCTAKDRGKVFEDCCMIYPLISGNLCQSFPESSLVVHIYWMPTVFPKQPSHFKETAFPFIFWDGSSSARLFFFFLSFFFSDKTSCNYKLLLRLFKLTGKYAHSRACRDHVCLSGCLLFINAVLRSLLRISPFIGRSPALQLTMGFQEPFIFSFTCTAFNILSCCGWENVPTVNLLSPGLMLGAVHTHLVLPLPPWLIQRRSWILWTSSILESPCQLYDLHMPSRKHPRDPS